MHALYCLGTHRDLRSHRIRWALVVECTPVSSVYNTFYFVQVRCEEQSFCVWHCLWASFSEHPPSLPQASRQQCRSSHSLDTDQERSHSESDHDVGTPSLSRRKHHLKCPREPDSKRHTEVAMTPHRKFSAHGRCLTDSVKPRLWRKGMGRVLDIGTFMNESSSGMCRACKGMVVMEDIIAIMWAHFLCWCLRCSNYEHRYCNFTNFQWSRVLPKFKRHLNEQNTLSDHGSTHEHRNLNETERSAIARYWSLTHRKFVKLQNSIRPTDCVHTSWHLK